MDIYIENPSNRSGRQIKHSVAVLNPRAHSGLHRLLTFTVDPEGIIFHGIIDDDRPRNTVWSRCASGWNALRQLVQKRFEIERRAFEYEEARDAARNFFCDLIDSDDPRGADRSKLYSQMVDLRESIMGSKKPWVEDVLYMLPEVLPSEKSRTLVLENLLRAAAIFDKEAERQHGMAASTRSDHATMQELVNQDIRNIEVAYWTLLNLERSLEDSVDARPSILAKCEDVYPGLAALRIEPFRSQQVPLLEGIERIQMAHANEDYTSLMEHLHAVVNRLTLIKFRIDLEQDLVKLTEYVESCEEVPPSTIRFLSIGMRSHTETVQKYRVPSTDDVAHTFMISALTKAYQMFEQLASLPKDRKVYGHELKPHREALKAAVRRMH